MRNFLLTLAAAAAIAHTILALLPPNPALAERGHVAVVVADADPEQPAGAASATDADTICDALCR